jgi:L-rhamnose-H+ transport protein
MSVLYTGSISVYGLGASRMGEMGAIIGFPMYMSVMIVTGNVAGLVTGEWKGSPRSAYRYGLLGVLALIGSIIIIALGSPKVA